MFHFQKYSMHELKMTILLLRLDWITLKLFGLIRRVPPKNIAIALGYAILINKNLSLFPVGDTIFMSCTQ